MTTLLSVLPIVQIVLSILLIAGVLGGGDGSITYHKRRGLEKFLFYFTIVIGILFAVSALIAVIFS